MPNCSGRNLRSFDATIDVTLRDKDPGSQKEYIQFDLDKTYDDPHNHAVIMEIFNYVREKGAEQVPITAVALRVIKDVDLLGRVQEKFKQMRKAWVAWKKEEAATAEAIAAAQKAEAAAAQALEDADWNDDVGAKNVVAPVVLPAPVAIKKRSTAEASAKVQSRAVGVSLVRLYPSKFFL